MDKKSKNIESAPVGAGTYGHLAKSEDSLHRVGDPSKVRDVKAEGLDVDKNQGNVSVSKLKPIKIFTNGFFGCPFYSN